MLNLMFSSELVLDEASKKLSDDEQKPRVVGNLCSSPAAPHPAAELEQVL